jgi:hypothetical protein
MSPEIESHAQQCAVCSDILLVTSFLNQEARAGYAAIPLPSADLIWKKAEWRARQQAMTRALRPIRFMMVIACLAFACSPWLGSLLPFGRELAAWWSRSLDINLASFLKIWPATANQPVILLACFGTILLLGLSSWYMLRQE